MSSDPTPTARMETAYVAVRYSLGARGSELLVGLREPGLEARSLATGLGNPERQLRAQILAPEMARLLVGLGRLEAF